VPPSRLREVETGAATTVFQTLSNPLTVSRALVVTVSVPRPPGPEELPPT
jgi:hypothetical protein